MVRSFNKVRKNRKRAGFTLIELLVVVLILGILLAVAIPLYLSSVRNAATKVAMANVKMVAQAAQAYRVRTGSYPTALTDIVGTGKDVEATLNGNPKNVNYTYAAVGTTGCTVTATESGGDAINTNATGETIVYTLPAGEYSGTGYQP